MRGKNPQSKRSGMPRAARVVSGKLPQTANIPTTADNAIVKEQNVGAANQIALTPPYVHVKGQVAHAFDSMGGRYRVHFMFDGEEQIVLNAQSMISSIPSMAIDQIDPKGFQEGLKTKDEHSISAGFYALKFEHTTAGVAITPSWRDNNGDWHKMPRQDFLISPSDKKAMLKILRNRKITNMFK